MVETRLASKNKTDINVGVNRDVAEASNKNTMNRKRKTTAENSILKLIEASKKTTKKVNTENARTSKKSKSREKSKARKKSKSPEESDESYESDDVIECKPTVMDFAEGIFMREYLKEYREAHRGIRPPFKDIRLGQKVFLNLSEEKKSKYVKMYKDEQAEILRRHKEELRKAGAD